MGIKFEEDPLDIKLTELSNAEVNIFQEKKAIVQMKIDNKLEELVSYLLENKDHSEELYRNVLKHFAGDVEFFIGQLHM